MKVLNKMKESDFPLIIDCECGASLEIEKDDVDKHCLVTCPICGEDIDVREYTDECYIALEDINYPTDFFHFGQSGSQIDTTTINKWIQAGVAYFKSNPQPKTDFWYTASGDSIVIMTRNDDGEIEINVAKNYYNYLHCED